MNSYLFDTCFLIDLEREMRRGPGTRGKRRRRRSQHVHRAPVALDRRQQRRQPWPVQHRDPGRLARARSGGQRKVELRIVVEQLLLEHPQQRLRHACSRRAWQRRAMPRDIAVVDDDGGA